MINNKNEKKIHILNDLVGFTGHQSGNTKPEMYIGVDNEGKHYFDLLGGLTLISGSTGSGKSLFLETLVIDLVTRYTSKELNLILVDLKRVQYTNYFDLPHLIAPVVMKPRSVKYIFEWLLKEMEERYTYLRDNNLRYIEQTDKHPHIVLVVEEIADSMCLDPVVLEKHILKVAQLSKAVGIHVILATQRPSSSIFTDLMKGNANTLISFYQVGSNSESFIGISDAGNLKGKGDLLYITGNLEPLNLQADYLSQEDIVQQIKDLANKQEQIFNKDLLNTLLNEPYIELENGEKVDELYEEAVELFKKEGKLTTSLLQRKLSIGYSRAARLLDLINENN